MSAQPPEPGQPQVPDPGTIHCPRCTSPVAADQDWCLECGAPARTRLAQTPNWRLPTVAIAAIVAIAGALLAFAFVKLTSDDDAIPASTVPTAAAPVAPPPVVQPPVATAPVTVPATGTPTAPATTATATTTAPSATSTQPAATTTTAPGPPPRVVTATTPQGVVTITTGR